MKYNQINLLESIIIEQLFKQNKSVDIKMWRGQGGSQKLSDIKPYVSNITKSPIHRVFTITSKSIKSETETENIIKTSPDLKLYYSTEEPAPYSIICTDWKRDKLRYKMTCIVLKGELEIVATYQQLENELWGTPVMRTGGKIQLDFTKTNFPVNIFFTKRINDLVNDIKEMLDVLNQTNSKITPELQSQIKQFINTDAESINKISNDTPIDSSAEDKITKQSSRAEIIDLQQTIIDMFNRHPEILETAPENWSKKIKDFTTKYKTDGIWGTNMSDIVQLLNTQFSDNQSSDYITKDIYNKIKQY